MVFPEYIKKNDWIGVTAMSHSIEDDVDRFRFENAKNKLEQKGYRVVFTPNVFNESDRFGRSSSAQTKADEFNGLAADKNVRAIYSAAGGDFLAEMLPYVDIDAFRADPKWVQGYSDNTSILYYLTTKGDVATAYGANFGDFGMDEWNLSVSRGLEILEGRCRVQESFEYYQDGFADRITGLEGYSADAPVRWRCITSADDECCMKGRLIGGCMDVLLNIAGTPYDGTLEFAEKYRDDGIIWYLESFDLHFEQMMEGLWKMKEMGWFRHASGFVFGRPLFYPQQAYDGSQLPAYEDVVMERLGELGVPVILDADVGHKGPQFVMINGALARVSCGGGKGRVEYI